MNQLMLLLLPFLSYSLDTVGTDVIQWAPEIWPAGGAKGAVVLHNGYTLAARSRRHNAGRVVVCSQSADQGQTWEEIDTIVQVRQPGVDIGDGHLIECQDGRIFYSYRHNHYRGDDSAQPRYSIRVMQSEDGGRIWEPHSTVEQVASDTGLRPSRGLWSSFLLQRRDGTLQCYYDDENTPYLQGFPGHQWLQMKTWNAEASIWEQPVTVSRAFDPAHLSRDGMVSVVELPSGRLFAAFESVQVTRPHANLVRWVSSDDGGQTWNWREHERAVLFAPAKQDFMALSPWLTQLSDGALICVFATDEDRNVPDVSGTPVPQLNMDVKGVLSLDGGATWPTQAFTIYAGSHRSYMPGAVELIQPGDAPTLLVLWLDTGQGNFGRLGTLTEPRD